MHAEVGGFKEVNDWKTNSLKNVSYNSAVKDYYEFVEVRFDFVSPKHCSENGDCGELAEPGVSPGVGFTKVKCFV